MELFRAVIIRPHTGLYEYGKANLGIEMPVFLWPSTVLSTVLAYLVLVKLVLPAFMAKRPAYELRTFMLVYNVLQLLANAYMAVTTVSAMLAQLDGGGAWDLLSGCPTRTPALVRVHVLWFLNKYCDLIETVVFVLRRKAAQVTFLHVYHHIIVIYYAYMSFVEDAGGYQVLPGMQNMFVHTFMYAYYFASVYDREWTRGSIDYKRRITQLQMVQFCVNMLWFAKPSVGWCRFPKYLAYSGCVQNGVLFALFANFYYHAYVKGAQKKVAKKLK